MRCSLEFFGGIYVRYEGEEDKQVTHNFFRKLTTA